MIEAPSSLLPQIQGESLRAIGVTSARRFFALPDVPTLAESGLAGFDQGTWFGILAPAHTPKELVAKINKDIVAVLSSPDTKARFADVGAQPIGDTPEQMAARVHKDTAKYAPLVKQARVRIE